MCAISAGNPHFWPVFNRFGPPEAELLVFDILFAECHSPQCPAPPPTKPLLLLLVLGMLEMLGMLVVLVVLGVLEELLVLERGIFERDFFLLLNFLGPQALACRVLWILECRREGHILNGSKLAALLLFLELKIGFKNHVVQSNSKTNQLVKKTLKKYFRASQKSTGSLECYMASLPHHTNICFLTFFLSKFLVSYLVLLNSR